MKILYTTLLCLSLSVISVSAKKIKVENEEIFPWLRTVSKVCAELKSRSFRTIDFPTAFKEALKSMVSTADAHSAFFTPESYKSTMESATGEFSGIGISIMGKPQDEPLVVIEALDGGPAEKAGIKSKDKIVEVDGSKLKGLSTDESIALLKGKNGTKVKIKIIRENKPFEFTVTRGVIKDRTSTAYHFVDQNIFYLSLRQFAENSVKNMSKVIGKASKDKARGLIIDLRRNPGGVLEAAVDIAGLFVEKGSPVVITKDKKREVNKTYKTTRKPVFKGDMPVFLLVDSFTASASEILAGVLRHYSNQDNNNLQVFTLGMPSFGKGSVQEVFPISNGCALKLTTMLYYLPDDTSIQAVGITPDFTIKPKITPEKELKWVSELYGKETTLKGHISREEVDNPDAVVSKKNNKKLAKKKKEEEKEETMEQKRLKALGRDVQIQASINMINLLNLAKASIPKEIKTRKQAIGFLKKHYTTDDQSKIVEVK